MVSLQDLHSKMTDSETIFLICPICRGELILEKPYRRFGRVRTGNLRCKEGCAVYPIIYGVPVMLSPGQPANFDIFYKPWKPFLQKHGAQKMIEALATGELDIETKVSGPSVSGKMLRKAKRAVSKAGWQRHLKRARTSSEDADAIAVAERLRQIEGGVILDVGCGGGFTTERALQETQASVCCVAMDVDFECVKLAGKRAALLGMEDRCMEICADARHLPFVDESLTAAYTRLGFWHIYGYVDAFREVYRTLKNGGRLVATEYKTGWIVHVDSRLRYEERREILRNLGLVVDKQEFIENAKQVGFDALAIDDLPEPKSAYFLFEATK